METTRQGTKTTSGVTTTETPHSPDAPHKGVPPRGKKRTAKRTSKELEVTQNDEEPPKKKAKLELPEKTDYKRQLTEEEKESTNTGQYNTITGTEVHPLIFLTS